jgi:hypothetical protein
MTAGRRLAALATVLTAGSVASCQPNQDTGGEAAARSAVRDYIASVDARSGGRLCREMAPGALANLAVPKHQGSCAASLAASIGYRDPRGYPIWRHTRLQRFRSVALEGTTARATVRVKTTFADGREPSIEDDVIYLDGGDGRWLVAKPSATLYRAIGAPSPPISAFRPPGGG